MGVGWGLPSESGLGWAGAGTEVASTGWRSGSRGVCGGGL